MLLGRRAQLEELGHWKHNLEEYILIDGPFLSLALSTLSPSGCHEVKHSLLPCPSATMFFLGASQPWTEASQSVSQNYSPEVFYLRTGKPHYYNVIRHRRICEGDCKPNVQTVNDKQNYLINSLATVNSDLQRILEIFFLKSIKCM